MVKVLFMSLLIIITLLWFYSRRIYKGELTLLHSKEYRFFSFLSIGLFILDRIPLKKFMNKENNHLLTLYGKQEYKIKKRYYDAERITLFVLFTLFSIVVGLLLNVDAYSGKVITSIEKRPFLEDEKKVELSYKVTFNNKEYKQNYDLLIQEVEPTKDDLRKYLTDIADQLPQVILNGNPSFSKIQKSLYLPETYEKVDLEWESSHPEIINPKGEINFFNIKQPLDDVIMTVTMTFQDTSYQQTYPLVILPRVHNDQDKLQQVKLQLDKIFSNQNLSKEKNIMIDLPAKVNTIDEEITWYDQKRPTSLVIIFVLSIVVGSSFYVLRGYELQKLIMKRNEELLKDFPSFINKLSLLMKAGMTFKKAWIKVATDYRAVQLTEQKKKVLYEEILRTVANMEKGESENQVYQDFAQRCNIPEILKFTSIVIQSLKKGNGILLNILEEQSKEALELRENLAKKKGEKASTKLILPMGIMLIAVMIIVTTPAILSLRM